MDLIFSARIAWCLRSWQCASSAPRFSHVCSGGWHTGWYWRPSYSGLWLHLLLTSSAAPWVSQTHCHGGPLRSTQPPSMATAPGFGSLWYPWDFLQGWHEDMGGNSLSLGSPGSGPACWGRRKRSARHSSFLKFFALMGFPIENHCKLVFSLAFSI